MNRFQNRFTVHQKYHKEIVGFSEYSFRVTGSSNANVSKNVLVFFQILVYVTELQEIHTVICDI